MNQKLAGSPAQRRTNGAVAKLYFCILHGGLVGADGRFQRTRVGMKLFILFSGYKSAFIKLLGTICLSPRILFLSQVAGQIGFRLLESRVIRAGINCEELIPFFHVLTFMEVDAVQLPIHLRFNHDRGIGLTVSNDMHFDRDGFSSHGSDRHRNCEAHSGLCPVSCGTVLGTRRPE